MDNTITLSLQGRIPSKKNSKFIVTTRRGYSMPVSSSEFKSWERSAIKSISLQRMLQNITQPIIQCIVSIEVIFPDQRKRDLSNVAEGIMDVLVQTGVLADDNWRVVNKLELIAVGADKEKAGAKISIKLPEKGMGICGC